MEKGDTKPLSEIDGKNSSPPKVKEAETVWLAVSPILTLPKGTVRGALIVAAVAAVVVIRQKRPIPDPNTQALVLLSIFYPHEITKFECPRR